MQMSELHAQNANKGNLILVREKPGNCQRNLLCSNYGHRVISHKLKN